MKTFTSLALAAIALLGATVSADPKQLYHVTAPKTVFDTTVAKFHGELDVWSVKPVLGAADKVTADVYATESEIAFFQSHTSPNQRMVFGNETLIQRDPVNTQELLAERAVARATCATKTRRHLEELATITGKYTANAFFDCFRQSSEVFAFFDQLVVDNPTIFSKIAKVTTTVEGRTVPGYKISTGSGRKPIYTQGLIHAREWIAGSSTFYVMAGLLDGLRSGDSTVTALFQKYDWVFVPILNLDGYQYSWSSDRMWRKNRKKISGSTYGVDLNRNYPPNNMWGKGGDGPSSDAYPGSGPLSEPETAGSWSFIKSLNPWGAIDMHSYAGLILRAYGNKQGTPPAPYGPKLKVLGDAMTKAAGSSYQSQTSAQLYVAYGCFDDAVFQELNKPVFTIEMAGSSFIASESTIRTAGNNMYKAFLAFGNGLDTYWSGLSHTPPTPAPLVSDASTEPRVRLTSKPLALVVVVVVLSAALSLSTTLQDTHVFPTTLRGLRLESDVTAMRKDAVKNAMKFVWSNYHTRAFGADEMTPLDGLPVNEWGGVGCMLLDSMDTLWIMDLHAEFEQAKQWVHKELSFESMGIVSVFETIIRSLGGLLSAYDLSGDGVFLAKAVELAERLLPAINTTTGRAFYYLDAASKSASRPGGLAESGSYQLEFEYLSRASGDPKYANLAKKLYPYLLSQREIQVDGLFANDIFQVDSAFKASSLTVTMGGGGDSFYEYLLKVWLLQGQPNNALTKQMYLAAIDGMEKLLLNKSTTGHTYIGDFDLVTKTPVARLAHLACFVPGLLALGADRLREEDPLRSERHLKIAKQLMETCYKDLYLQQPSRLSPEYVQGPLLQPPPFSGYSAGYKLRPEVVESLYVMHQLTGDSIYQEWGWQFFTAIDRNCRTRYGYAQYLNVQEEVVWSTDPQERAIQTARLLENKMETFFPAETLKYLYLLFDVDNRHVRLDTHVFNTEAHPLSIFRD